MKKTLLKTIKKSICILFIIIFVLSMASCAKSENNNGDETDDTTLSDSEALEAKKNEVRGIWLSYGELAPMLSENKDAQSFEKHISSLFKNIKDCGFNTVYIHARAFSDAFYYSSIFPSASYFTGTQGDKAPYDMLAVAVKAAHENSLKIEAWVNPYRISSNQDLEKLASSNPAKVWLTDSNADNDSWIIKVNGGGLYYNPAVDECIALITDGISEIVNNYDVDGIHFDDYFYPVQDGYIDEIQYVGYTAGGGQSTLEQWRRDNVNRLIKSVYSAVKKEDENVVFGVSPSASIRDNYNKNYADLSLWAQEAGYVDYLCPQVYFGFENQVQPFVSTVKKWQSLMRKSHAQLYFGLALYKSGLVDEYADVTDGSDKSSPKYEFVNHSDIISRQINYLRHIKPYGGFAIFSYSYMFAPQNETAAAEAELIRQAMA